MTNHTNLQNESKLDHDLVCWKTTGHYHQHIQQENNINDVGPTFVGDEWSDPELMDTLGARLIKQVGNNFAQYKSDDPPRIVMNKLEKLDYRLVSMTGVGQTCIWTLHKELSEQNCDEH